MKPRDRGFTLLELVIVIVILGILGAMSLPMFGNMVPAAADGASEAAAGSLSAAAAGNYASCKVGGTWTSVATCDDATALVTSMDWTEYTVASVGGAADGFINCSVIHASGGTTFTTTLRTTTGPCP